MLPQTLSITLQNDKPIYQQIVAFIQEQINQGILTEDSLLPSTRQLSIQLAIHRNTVTEAYERLVATGWLYTIEKKGTFVSSRNKAQLSFAPPIETLYGFHSFSHFKKPMELPMKRHYAIKLDEGNPDPNLAPVFDLAIAYKRSYSMHLRLQKTDLMPEYPDHSEILAELDKSVAHYSGVRLDNDHSCFIMGIQNALYLVAQTLISKDDTIVVETPGNPLAWEVFHMCGAKVLPVSVDRDGFRIDGLKKILESTTVKAIYITPQIQYPTTVTLSAERRTELLQLASQLQ